ncbi:MAG: YcgN family cysteine cluster protein [Deltaproteobacteria bacterium]|nr:YcgN family cysteine cluster protein [Deltaproteobacteria bacterium]
MAAKRNFWREKSLWDMTTGEWESLCDGCGWCCLIKIEDDTTQTVHYTGVACRFLDLETCRCTCYENRTRHAQDCLVLAPDMIAELTWLPSTCAYRLIFEGRDLPWWHHLVTGDRETVHDAGFSVRSVAISEKFVNLADLEAYVLDRQI